MVENESKFCVGDPKNVHLKQMDEARENLHLFRPMFRNIGSCCERYFKCAKGLLGYEGSEDFAIRCCKGVLKIPAHLEGNSKIIQGKGPPPKLQFFAWDSLLNLRDRDSSLLVPMAGLEELKKKLQPLLFDDSDKGGVSTRVPFPEDTCDSYVKINIFEKNDEDVKVVVGKSLDQIVLDESKDVLLESLEPIYNKLAKFLHGIDSLVIAKMDGTNNEHPRA
ncbi:hypothetical protein ZWY2020_005732 [Hordeum vulgare]|nr:hypothetical protein ZWY2020_005732 [Hordeum vulgare]